MIFPRRNIRLFPALLVLAVVSVWWATRPGDEPALREVREEKVLSEEVGFTPFEPISRDSQVPLPKVPLPQHSKGAIPGEFTVSFKDEAAMEAFLAKAEARGVTILGTLPPLLMVRISASGSLLKGLLEDGMGVDNNYRVVAPAFPDAELWQNQNLSAIGQNVLEFLGAPIFGERIQWGQGVTVAVLDTGWVGHAAVKDNSVRYIDMLNSEGEGDFSGHGTAVAGLINSINPFAPGIAPGSEILAVRVLDGNGEGDAFTLAAGILAAVDNGAQVINMSLGSYGDSEVLRQAVQYAAERGIVMVAASGNDGQAFVTYPAAYDQVIAVAAVDAEGNRAPFSNYGAEIDIAAPGYQVHALWTNNEFIYFDGTSASAPLVSGMAARIIEANLASSAEEVRQILLDYANETGLPGNDFQYGAGILNAERIESIGESGIVDMALADLYPAIEQSDGATFPLYVSLENRGTEYIPGATVEISVNGKPYYYRFSGMESGRVESVQIPVPEDQLSSGEAYTVSAKVKLPDKYKDSRPANNEGEISLSKPPNDG